MESAFTRDTGKASAGTVGTTIVGTMVATATLTGVAVSCRAKKAGASTLIRTKAGKPAAYAASAAAASQAEFLEY